MSKTVPIPGGDNETHFQRPRIRLAHFFGLSGCQVENNLKIIHPIVDEYTDNKGNTMNAIIRFCRYWHQEAMRLKLADNASLLLRLWLGLSMITLHGWGKLSKLMTDPTGFPDPLGVGVVLSLGLAAWAEFICSLLIIIGFATRLALTQLMATMMVAFFFVHGAALLGPMSGEMAFIYLGAYTGLLILGPGRISLDHLMLKKKAD